MYIFNEFCYKEIHLINMSLLDHVNWDFGAIRGAFCCCVGSLSSFYTAAGCAKLVTTAHEQIAMDVGAG